MKTHQLINQTSGDEEYYTPPFIIEAARKVLGVIDLDPASSRVANRKVRARWILTRKDNGIDPELFWLGRVWLNHPFGRTQNSLWISKLIREYDLGHTVEALCITYACTSEAWFQPLLQYPQCFLTPRTNYYLPNGKLKRGVTKGSVVTYLGTNQHNFAREFIRFGVVKTKSPWR